MKPLTPSTRVIAAGLLALGIGTSAAPAPPRPACPAPDAADYYFPVDGPDLDAGLRQDASWYSAQLRAMDEPPLACGPDPQGAVYRFTWLRTFDHPIAIRVEAAAQGARLEAVELDGAGGYTPGRPLHRLSRQLDADQLRQVREAMAQALAVPARDNHGLDGAQWIFESRDGPHYQTRAFWSPTSSPERQAGMLLLTLSGLQVPTARRY